MPEVEKREVEKLRSEKLRREKSRSKVRWVEVSAMRDQTNFLYPSLYL
jgi:hypothetical protein